MMDMLDKMVEMLEKNPCSKMHRWYRLQIQNPPLSSKILAFILDKEKKKKELDGGQRACVMNPA